MDQSRSDGVMGDIGDADIAELMSMPSSALHSRSQPLLASQGSLQGLSGQAVQQDVHAGWQPGASSLLLNPRSGPSVGLGSLDGRDGRGQDALLSIQSTSALLHAAHELPERPSSLSSRQLLLHSTTMPVASPGSHTPSRRSMLESVQSDSPGATHTPGESPQTRGAAAVERWSAATSSARTAIAAMFSRTLRTRMSNEPRLGGAGSGGRHSPHTALLRSLPQQPGAPLLTSLPAPSMAVGSALAESHDRWGTVVSRGWLRALLRAWGYLV